MAKRKKRKTLPPFHLNMDSDEALARFIQADPAQVEELIQRSKKKKKSAKEPATTEGVISLRDRRMKKRNLGR